MAKDPEIKLEISSHYFDEEIVDYNLFLSMKRAENIAAFLVQKGAKTAQIYLQAYGSNYPQQKKNRIEFAFKKGLNPNIQFIEKYSTEASLPFENKGLWYKLQIAESPDMYTNPILSLYKHSLLEWDDKNKLYLYSLGLYESYLLAKTAFDNLKAGGIEKVKIIPYLNGIRIQDSEIMELLAQYPDLKNYLAAYKN
jgi:hypothetical protein